MGYLNPDYFLGGDLKLDRERAEEALKHHVAEPLGMSVMEAARGALRVVDFQMADLIRQMTVGKGHDPRDFAVFAYGGAGPTHAPVFARELGVRQVVIPRGPFASLWSAYGAVSSDVLLVLERSHAQRAPFDGAALEQAFQSLEGEARDRLLAAGAEPERIEFRRYADLKYGMQVHVVDVPVSSEVTEANVEDILTDFDARYETLFGKGTGFRAAGVEMASIRVEAVASLPTPLQKGREAKERELDLDQLPTREVQWDEREELTDTPVVTEDDFDVGTVVAGPAIIELPVTTIPIHPGQKARVDATESIVLEL